MASFAQASRADELYAILEKYAPVISAGMRKAWEQGKLKVKLSELERLIKENRIDEAVALVMDGANPLFQEQAEESLRTTFIAAAEWAWKKDIPKASISVFRSVFDKLNPKTIDAMRANELRMINSVGIDTRDGLKQVLLNQLKDGMGPRQAARFIRDEPGFGLTASQEATVQRYKEFLSTVHEKRTLASLGIGMKRSLAVDAQGKPIDGIDKWRLRDMRFDRTLSRAQRESKALTKEQIDAQVTAYRRQFIKLRSETIARTESISAGASGSREAWRQMVASGVYPNGIRRYWFTALAGDRVCPYCKAIEHMNKDGRGLDEPFMTEAGDAVDNPPAHPACRCVVFIKGQ